MMDITTFENLFADDLRNLNDDFSDNEILQEIINLRDASLKLYKICGMELMKFRTLCSKDPECQELYMCDFVYKLEKEFKKLKSSFNLLSTGDSEG